jgi:hypothetical protein
MLWRPLLTSVLILTPMIAADHPAAEITNGEITAKLYLPDAKNGYYRGTRFDWSGVIHSLTYKGHQYFGEWQQSDDPYLHDRITGPVEEFRTNEKGLGYDEAKTSELFVRIGVGACEKPQEEDYRWTHSYKVVIPGTWTITQGKNWIQFTQDLDAKNGYAYEYTKRLTLTAGEPELVISHKLHNKGAKLIESNAYNHNFFVIDGQSTGPDFAVGFAFKPAATHDLKGMVELKGNELRYLREIKDGENIFTGLVGFGETAEDHQISIENRKVKAGVRFQTDKPLLKVNYWSPRTTLCPEPFIDLRIPPGAAESWTTRYDFYTID